jgi:hypothetical protein
MRRSSACQALFLGSSGVTPLPRPVWAASPEGGGGLRASATMVMRDTYKCEVRSTGSRGNGNSSLKPS